MKYFRKSLDKDRTVYLWIKEGIVGQRSQTHVAINSSDESLCLPILPIN